MSPKVREKGLAHLRLISPVALPGPAATGRSSPLDDSQLLTAMRAGDRAVAAAFHDRIRPQIERTLLRLFGRHDVDHDDVRQLALIEIVMTIHRFRGECSLDSWVSTVTGHIVFKHLRRRQIERKLFDVLERDDLLPPSTIGTPREPLLRSLIRRVSRHLEAMGSDKAWAFILHDVFGYDLKETAQILRVSSAAAQTRLFRGRAEIHDRIASDPELANLIEELGGWQ